MKKIAIILVALILSFIITGVLVKNVFLGQTKNINPSFVYITKNNISRFVGYLTNSKIRESIQQEQKLKQYVKTAPFKNLATGVSAAETPYGSYVKVNVDEVQYREYTFVIKDKEIKIKVPVNQDPPTQESIEQLAPLLNLDQ